MHGLKTVLAVATALALAGPALAQPASSIPGSEPLSTKASNTDASNSPSTVAPRLPTPEVGEDATTRAFLVDARRALANGRTGQAQEAMERAETRLLDRSVAPSSIGVPTENRLAAMIEQARHAVGDGDRARAMQILDATLAARPAG